MTGTYALSGSPVELTTSIGVAFHHERASRTLSACLKEQTQAMYESKRAGRGSPVLAGPLAAGRDKHA